MNRHVNAISGRLSLRQPQRRSLEILDRITEIVPLKKDVDLEAALTVIRSEFPTVTDFERDFPSLCFALATGVGKTRLMGAFITYLHLAHGFKNFFVLAPNLTIYEKLRREFEDRSHPKYVFTGIAEFATDPPLIITGDNYETGVGTRRDYFPGFERTVIVNVFNISKINSEVRGGKSPRIKRLSEYIGESYFDYLAGLKDLVLIMDESHRYRASAGVRAINELKPVLGLELTATPFVETSRGLVNFQNVIFDYPLGRAMTDGFVKEPAVVTRKDFSPIGLSTEELERIKLEDGVRLHETIKVELETYARETGNKIVKPFLLVIARDTTHAGQLLQLIQSETFFQGRYAQKAIQVDSSRTGAEEDEMIRRLLAVESSQELTEIVIHVNMLKEGWDVTNLYTIVPLRAANARTLIEQSIGRGLRLPFGKRTGVMAVDRLNIIAHDKFQEIIDEANRSDSPIRLQQVILSAEDLEQKTVTVVLQSQLSTQLGFQLPQESNGSVSGPNVQPVFQSPAEQKIAQLTYEVIRKFEHHPREVPAVAFLQQEQFQERIVQEVTNLAQPTQLQLEGMATPIDVSAVVAKATELIIQQTIDIPRILIVPKGEIRSGFHPFTLELDTLNYQPVSNNLWIQHIRTNQIEIISAGGDGIDEARLEDYIVKELMDFNDVDYDTHADFLYDLASQVVRHFQAYLPEEDIHKVLRYYHKDIARFVHTQMQEHYWEEAVEYEVKINRGFTELKKSALTHRANEQVLDFRLSPSDKSNMAKYLFGGFDRCLYPIQKFQSDSERKLAIILDRDSLKWFKPAKGQFQIFYRWEFDHLEYQPDFVAETTDCIYLVECKARNEMDDSQVIAKRDAAIEWCRHASEHAATYQGKPWKYLLIPHDLMAENMTLPGLARMISLK